MSILDLQALPLSTGRSEASRGPGSAITGVICGGSGLSLILCAMPDTPSPTLQEPDAFDR
jgi:hypothetical protein